MNTTIKEVTLQQELTMKTNKETSACNNVCETEIKKEIKVEAADPDFVAENEWQFFSRNLVVKTEHHSQQDIVDSQYEQRMFCKDPAAKTNHCNKDCEQLWWQERTSTQHPPCDNEASFSDIFPSSASERINTGIVPRDTRLIFDGYVASGLSSAGRYTCSSQEAASSHNPVSTAGVGSPYPTSLPIASTGLSSSSSSPSHSTTSQPTFITPGPNQENHNHERSTLSSAKASNNQRNKEPHIKKPLNVFMIYMKEMRAKVTAEVTNKESAAINQILGAMWRALGPEERAKYYELAHQERLLHLKLYPNWKCGYSYRVRKRGIAKRTILGKKCRAHYGLDQKGEWCEPCRRKKKCMRYKEPNDNMDDNQSEDAAPLNQSEDDDYWD